MAADWTDWADGNDLAGMSRSTDPLSRAGYDPDDVRANPQLRQQVLQQAGSPYGLQASKSPTMLSATGPVTPALDVRNAPAQPAAVPPMPNAAVTQPKMVPAVATAPASPKPVAIAQPSQPSQPAAPPSELDELGRQSLEKGLELGNFAAGNAKTLMSADPGTASLEAQAAKDAVPTPYLDPATGKVLDSAEQYKPSGWDKFGRGLKSAAVGFFAGGPFGAALGAIEPEMVHGGTAYEAPNKAYQTTEAVREQRLAGDQAQIANVRERFKEMTDARKAGNTAAGTAATAFGDVDRGVSSQQNSDAKLASQGLKRTTAPDGSSQIVPDTESPVYQARKALTDYHDAQTQLAQAKAALAQAGNDPNSPAYKLALAKERTAAANATAASERAGAYMLNSQAGALGSYNGVPLPGANITETGQPVGSHFATNVRPTGTERGRADLARSAEKQIGDMKDIILSNPDLFGPGSGRITNFRTWLGSQSPEAQRFRAAAQVAADHLAGVFGGRSEAALDHIYSVVGENITNPKAALAGLDQIESTVPGFVKAGTVHYVGDNTPVVPVGGGENAPPKGSGGNTGGSDWFKQHPKATTGAHQ